MNFSLEDMTMFVAIVNAQSISRAAEHLGLPKSNLSRRLKQLEQKLNARLIERTTRSQKLTDAGKTFYQGCEKILDQSSKLESAVQFKQHSLSGKLTVFAPVDAMRMLFSQQIGVFAKRYPSLEIEFLSGSIRPNLLKDQIDVVLHLNTPNDSSLVARKLTDVLTSYYASTDYLARYGTPETPEELLNHSCIVNLDQNRHALPWRYFANGKINTLPVKAHYHSDSSFLTKTLLLQGLGISLLPSFLCAEEEKDGRLIRLFNGKYEINDPVYALYPSREYLPEKTRLFLDFVQGLFTSNHRSKLQNN